MLRQRSMKKQQFISKYFARPAPPAEQANLQPASELDDVAPSPKRQRVVSLEALTHSPADKGSREPKADTISPANAAESSQPTETASIPEEREECVASRAKVDRASPVQDASSERARRPRRRAASARRRIVDSSASESNGDGDSGSEAYAPTNESEHSSSSASQGSNASSDDEPIGSDDEGSRARTRRKHSSAASSGRVFASSHIESFSPQGTPLTTSAPGKRAKFARVVGTAADADVQRRDQRTEGLRVFERSKKQVQGAKLTELERQFLDAKKAHPDAVLFVEVGYKYRFFGEDAEIASRVLNIYAVPDRNFMTASIPTHRLNVHVRRMVEAGYKVGIVSQTETAAVKAADKNSKNRTFNRELTALYTKSTLVDLAGDVAIDSGDGSGAMLLALAERATGGAAVRMAVVGVDASTGAVTYDEFDDSAARPGLQLRLEHLAPVEILSPPAANVSPDTDKALAMYARQHSARCEPLEALAKTGGIRKEGSSCAPSVGEAARAGLRARVSSLLDSSVAQEHLGAVDGLPSLVAECVNAVATYMEAYGLERALARIGDFTPFATASRMHLDAGALRNLEVFADDRGEFRGSLLALLQRTRTAFGARRLRDAVRRPFCEAAAIRERLDAVEFLRDDSCASLKSLLDSLRGVPDIEKGLTRVFYRRCSCADFLSVMQSLHRLAAALPRVHEDASSSNAPPLLLRLLSSAPDIQRVLGEHIAMLDAEAAASGAWIKLFRDAGSRPTLCENLDKIAATERALEEELARVRRVTGLARLDYMSVLTEEYLIELSRAEAKKRAGADWIQVNATTRVIRFRTPRSAELLGQLQLARELAERSARDEWAGMLSALGAHYGSMRHLVETMAELDCLSALAEVARLPGYSKPEVVDGSGAQELRIEGGRNPIVEAHCDSAFVPNSISVGTGTGDERCAVITGPNMGGKSTFIRQNALIVIMAQIGSFVPATSVRLTPFDAVYVRMGANDCIARGQSTFMVEMQEAADILRAATPRSLVIFDELGRGTSTYDGMAIASATLQFVLEEKKCVAFFVTHYPALAELEKESGGQLGNYHMSFMESAKNGEGDQRITFLYTAVRGAASKSYGLNVARLARIPSSILQEAAERSAALEEDVGMRACEFRLVRALEGNGK